jgi:hypothetical protein
MSSGAQVWIAVRHGNDSLGSCQVPLFSRGHDIVKAVMDDVAGGATVRDLTNANLVMIYGSSGGAGGLRMMLDAEAAHVATVSQAPGGGALGFTRRTEPRGRRGAVRRSELLERLRGGCPGTFNVPPFGTDVVGHLRFTVCR